MPNYVSKLGKWYPAKEVAQVKLSHEEILAGKSGTYVGPDRAAVEELKKQGVEFIGNDYRTQPDLIRQSRELGFKTVDEFLKTIHGVDIEKLKEEKEEVVIQQDAPIKRKMPSRQESGGDDTSGQGKHKLGGFGEPDPNK